MTKLKLSAVTCARIEAKQPQSDKAKIWATRVRFLRSGPPAPPWGQRDRRPVSYRLGAICVRGQTAASAGRKTNMGLNEGEQLGSALNLTVQA